MVVIRRHVRAEVDWDGIDCLEQLGLDEVSLKKGHKNFVVIVSARLRSEMKILAVLKDRKKKTVKNFLSVIPKRLVKDSQVGMFRLV